MSGKCLHQLHQSLGPEYSYLRRKGLGPAIKEKMFTLKTANCVSVLALPPPRSVALGRCTAHCVMCSESRSDHHRPHLAPFHSSGDRGESQVVGRAVRTFLFHRSGPHSSIDSSPRSIQGLSLPSPTSGDSSGMREQDPQGAGVGVSLA